MRLGPIGEVASGTDLGTDTTASETDCAANETSTVKSLGGSTDESGLAGEQNPEAAASGVSRRAGTDREATGTNSTGGQYSVLVSRESTTACTALSSQLKTALTATSVNCTSSLIEVPRQTAMRRGGGLLGAVPRSRYL